MASKKKAVVNIPSAREIPLELGNVVLSWNKTRNSYIGLDAKGYEVISASDLASAELVAKALGYKIINKDNIHANRSFN